MNFSYTDKVAESNRIEGITRPPTLAELDEFGNFMRLSAVSPAQFEAFLRVYQPGAKIRFNPGEDVRVGNHIPAPGGYMIYQRLLDLCQLANDAHAGNRGPMTAWSVHVKFEDLHPFTDGNGRAGRMLWYWMMGNSRMADLGFLHAFYYQTLQGARP